jgi:hypothetical protein
MVIADRSPRIQDGGGIQSHHLHAIEPYSNEWREKTLSDSNRATDLVYIMHFLIQCCYRFTNIYTYTSKPLYITYSYIYSLRLEKPGGNKHSIEHTANIQRSHSDP